MLRLKFAMLAFGLILLLCSLAVSEGDVAPVQSDVNSNSGGDAPDADSGSGPPAEPDSSGNVNKTSCVNETDCSNEPSPRGIIKMVKDNQDMLMRTLYVLLGVTSVIILYFIIRTVRTRRRKSKSKKYGVISTPGNDLEMAPLDEPDDEDEDMTVFEVNGLNK